MKKLVALCIAIAATTALFAQGQNENKYEIINADFSFEEEIGIQESGKATPSSISSEEEEVIYMVVESMPEFPGGQKELLKYLAENVRYPVEAHGIQGRVICQFVVNKDGSIVDVVAVRSSGEPSLDKEAIRVISSMPRWKPGMQRGKPVRVKYTVPINFRLEDREEEKKQIY